MISIIVPAYNEEKYLPAMLESLHAALGQTKAEIIVVDNESTDGTGEIATRFGARIVGESEHNISRVRNSGAGAAKGDILVFIDADTLVAPGLFEKIADLMCDPKCLGGSVAVEYQASGRKWVRFYLGMWQFAGRSLKWRQGALQFCRTDVFRELGGYDESIYVGEDIEFHWRLAGLARRSGGNVGFIEEPPVSTSSRRFNRFGLVRTMIFTHPVFIFILWRTPSVWRHWYKDAIR